jgi:hypothetical protein
VIYKLLFKMNTPLFEFLRNNDATLIIPLLSRLEIPLNTQVYLPDDVAVNFVSEHLNIPLNAILESGKFTQMLQYGVNPEGFPFGRDEGDRETIDGLAVLANMRIGGVTYKVIDGVLGKGNDLQELAITQTWIKLPNDIFAHLVRTNRIHGEHLLSLCSSNKALNMKCNSGNGHLFRQLLIDEFGIRLPADANARQRYAAIYRDSDIMEHMLLKIQGWIEISRGDRPDDDVRYRDDMLFPDDIYDFLYADQNSDGQIGLISNPYIGSEEVFDLYFNASRGIDMFEEMREEFGGLGLKKDIRQYAKVSGRTELELADEVGDDQHFDYDAEEKLAFMKNWVSNFTAYLRIIFRRTTDNDIVKRIDDNLQKLRDSFKEYIEGDIYGNFNEENIGMIDLTEDEIDLILKIHHAVLKGTIDISYVVSFSNQNAILQIVSRLE